jgi:hypothetical protein
MTDRPAAVSRPPAVTVDQSTRSELGEFVGCSRCCNGEWSGKAEERGWTRQGVGSWSCPQHPTQTTP